MDVAGLLQLRSIQSELSSSYLVFFNNLAASYSPSSPQGKKIREARNKVQAAVRMIGRILTAGVVTTTGEINQLYSLIDSINEDVRYFSDYIKKTKAARTRIDRIREKVGIGIEDLQLSSDVVKRKKYSDGRRNRGSVS